MPNLKYTISFLIIFCSGFVGLVSAQDRCGTDQYLKTLQLKGFETNLQFEEWFEKKLAVKAKGVQDTKRTQAAPYKIPVVIHVVHNGTNDPSNISDAQILSQLKVLNNDYNRTNADASNTPALFLDVAGSPQIEFVLAKQTPEGLPTNGILRINGGKEEWTVADNYHLKSLSYWPAEQYMNIWVCNLTDYLGYSQFPQTSLLDGLENSSTNRLTDGVVISYTAFGSIDDGDFPLAANYNKGRTATHEIGHFFGLRHIWGDDEGSCGGSGDYVSDTPDQSDRTYNCPTHPRSTCNTTSMFQNFLDYTNDACMNLFTEGQSARMAVIIENSPRRSSLLVSPGLQDPQPVANDLGLKEIISPDGGECKGEFVPVLNIRNYGNNSISSAQIVLKRNGTTIETKNFALSLDVLEAINVSFSAVTVTEGTNDFSFQILSTNGGADGNGGNNLLVRTVNIPKQIETPFFETLESLPADWKIINPDNLTTWESAPVVNSTSTKGLKMNFYDYEDNEGELDIFVSPEINFSNVPVALLLFDVAYAPYQTSKDGLKVVVLSDCNSDINQGEVIYYKSGDDLATAEPLNEPFETSSINDWRTESVNLEQYIGKSIQIAFVGVNDWGNNLYLDNIKVLTEHFTNLTLQKVIAPSPITCNVSVKPVIKVRNSGTDVSSFDISYSVNGVTKTESFTNLDFPPGGEYEFTLQTIDLQHGLNSISFEVQNPDGEPDLYPNDNSLTFEVLSSKKETGFPFRERFEGSFDQKWSILSPKGNATWEPANINANYAQFYEGYVNSVIGDEAWLVSPVFDLTDVDAASMTFEVSYALRNNISEILQVRIAQGCDAPFEIIESYTGESLSGISSATPWSPTLREHWYEQYINLSNYTGRKDVQLAFIVSNKNGNNLYLDNIQLYSSIDPSPVKVSGAFGVYPNPTSQSDDLNITFNLPELADIELEILDGLGKTVFSEKYINILNQTYQLNFIDQAPGMYIVRVKARDKVYFSKLIKDK